MKPDQFRTLAASAALALALGGATGAAMAADAEYTLVISS